jgi:serine/threonine protein kinase
MEAIADYTDLRSGGGGLGEALLAAPPARLGLTGPVVLRVLDVGLDPEGLGAVAEVLQRFAGVGSPHLVRLFEAGHQEGRLFYSVEHLDRGTLAEPGGELERSGVLTVVADAARGAHALHEAGIAHRDISPLTIVLHDEGGKLAEPDLARLLEPGVTVRSGAPAVSVECTDPAVVRGEQPGRASDIWSLGATLHRAVSGHGVYGQDVGDGDLLSMVRRVLTTRPAVAPGLDPAVAEIVAACLAPDPDERPPTALAVAERLEGLL